MAAIANIPDREIKVLAADRPSLCVFNRLVSALPRNVRIYWRLPIVADQSAIVVDIIVTAPGTGIVIVPVLPFEIDFPVFPDPDEVSIGEIIDHLFKGAVEGAAATADYLGKRAGCDAVGIVGVLYATPRNPHTEYPPISAECLVFGDELDLLPTMIMSEMGNMARKAGPGKTMMTESSIAWLDACRAHP